MTPGDRVAAKNKALDLLNGLDGTFSGVRNALIERLEACPVGDSATQHEIALMLQLLKQLKAHLLSYVNDGRLAEAEQEQENWIQRAKRRLA